MIPFASMRARSTLFTYLGAASFAGVSCMSSSAAAQSVEDTAIPAYDAKAVCIADFEEAQRARLAGRLLEAHGLLLQCSSRSCGTALMTECTQMYTEVERALPSVVLSAKAEGRNVDLSAVEVLIDGRPFAPSIDGRPIAVDPGEYEFTFNAPGHTPLKRRIVIRTGDKYRMIAITFPAEGAPGLQPDSAPPPAGADRLWGVPVMSYVLGGLSVVGLGTSGVLRIVADNDFDTLKHGCKTTCPRSDVSNLRQKYSFSTISLGVGAAAAAGAVLWYALDSDSSSGPEVGARVGFEPARGGGMATASGSF